MRTTKEILNTFSVDQLLEDAVSAIGYQKHYDALHMLNTLLVTDPYHQTARLKKGLCHLYLNQPRKAAFMFDQILKENETHAEALACYAEYFKIHFDYETAAQYISAAIASDDTYSGYFWQAAEISFLKRDYDAAYSMINRAIVLSPFKEELYYWRALILNSFKKVNVALNDLNRALALNPQYVDALKLRAKIKMYHGTFDEAVKDLKMAGHFENRAETRRLRVA